MIKAGIIGATGYAGAELVRLLTGHKEVEIKYDEDLILEDINIKGYNFLGWYKDTEKIENQVFKFNTNILRKV